LRCADAVPAINWMSYREGRAFTASLRLSAQSLTRSHHSLIFGRLHACLCVLAVSHIRFSHCRGRPGRASHGLPLRCGQNFFLMHQSTLPLRCNADETPAVFFETVSLPEQPRMRENIFAHSGSEPPELRSDPGGHALTPGDML